jgi:hypothetical protein
MGAVQKISGEVKDRVVSSYKSTLVGLACGVGLIICQVAAEYLAADAALAARPWTGAVAALLALIGASLKSKAL